MLLLKESQIAKDLALRFAAYCSPRVLKQLHNAFNMTEEGGNYVAFSKFCVKFHQEHFDHDEVGLDEYPTLQSQADWDNAVTAAVASNDKIEGDVLIGL